MIVTPRSRRPFFRQITIIGMGLLGGSLSCAIHEKKLARRVFGVYHRKRTLALGRGLGLPHRPVMGMRRDVLAASDAVILALPVRSIRSALARIAPHLRPGTLVMDVGSTKRGILNAARRLPRHLDFIGCHPMAGSEKMGPRHARADLFRDAVCFVIRQGREPARRKCIRFWKTLGCVCVSVSARDHDRITSRISHLPHLVATALVTASAQRQPRLSRFAGTGYRDATRIAASGHSLWLEIIRSNRDFIGRDLKRFIRELGKIHRWVSAPTEGSLKRHLARAERLRKSLG